MVLDIFFLLPFLFLGRGLFCVSFFLFPVFLFFFFFCSGRFWVSPTLWELGASSNDLPLRFRLVQAYVFSTALDGSLCPTMKRCADLGSHINDLIVNAHKRSLRSRLCANGTVWTRVSSQKFYRFGSGSRLSVQFPLISGNINKNRFEPVWTANLGIHFPRYFGNKYYFRRQTSNNFFSSEVQSTFISRHRKLELALFNFDIKVKENR